MKHIIFSVVALLCLHLQKVHAFDYFNSGINYWNEAKKEVPKKSVNLSKKKNEVAKNDSEKFDWKKQLNPKNDDFFTEGNHKPPKALMELARNPTDQNIKNWFKLVEMKNKLTTRLQKRISEYVAKNSMKPKEREILSNVSLTLPKTAKNFKRFKFRLYFESSCPHCKRMMVTMKELQEMGHFVEIRQIDDAKIFLPFPMFRATKKELKEKKINSWPVLLVADTSKKLIYRIDGYRGTSEVLQILSTK